MAKGKKPAKAPEKVTKKRGPYLAAACFCEQVIEDKNDGVMSAIRMVDKFIILLPPSVVPADFPSEEKQLPIAIKGLLSFKTGDFPGEHTLRLVMHSPSGKQNPPVEQKIVLSPEPSGGANVQMNNVFQIVAGGLFWLDVFLDDVFFTSMPLHIVLDRAEVPVRTQAPAGAPVQASKAAELRS